MVIGSKSLKARVGPFTEFCLSKAYFYLSVLFSKIDTWDSGNKIKYGYQREQETQSRRMRKIIQGMILGQGLYQVEKGKRDNSHSGNSMC